MQELKKYYRDGTGRRYSKDILLHHYIMSHDVITEDIMHAMTFNNCEAALRNYTKRKGVIFEYIGNDTWVIIK